MKIKELLLAAMAVTGMLSVEAQSTTNSFPSTGNANVGTANYLYNGRMYYQSFNYSKNGNTRGNIANNLYWSTTDSVWTTTSSTSSDFGLLRFENGGAIGFFSGASTGSTRILSNDSLETYRRVIIKNNGYVGIGTASPSALLHVSNPSGLGQTAGNTIEIARFAGTTTNVSQLRIQLNRFANGTDWYSASTRLQCVTDITNQGYIEFNPSGSTSGFAIGNANTEYLRVVNSGNVLIGKTAQINTGYKLDVAGSVRADKVIVNTTGADFVFDPSYNLISLDEVESFIRNHRHLPQIAPASDMQMNGVDLGDNQIKLLQKTEELTLYLIEQNRQLQEQKEINTVQNRKIEALTEENRQLKAQVSEIELLKQAVKALELKVNGSKD
ncbi:MAG: hypothetical protein QM640_03025 [Niabella sp.]